MKGYKVEKTRSARRRSAADLKARGVNIVSSDDMTARGLLARKRSVPCVIRGCVCLRSFTSLAHQLVEVVLLCSDVSNDWPFGEPRPVQGSHPVPAEKAPLLPLVMSKNGASPSG